MGERPIEKEAAMVPVVFHGSDGIGSFRLAVVEILKRQDIGSLSAHGRSTQLFILLFRVLRMICHPCARARMVPADQWGKAGDQSKR